MSLPRPGRKWLRLPGRVALLLGLGAISAAGGKAAAPEMNADLTRVPQQSAKTFGQALVWNENGRVYVSEAGGPARELLLGDTLEAQRLRDLLQREGAVAASPHALRPRMILVGGGGMGISWEHPQKAVPADRAPGAAKTDSLRRPFAHGEQMPRQAGAAATPDVAGTQDRR